MDFTTEELDLILQGLFGINISVNARTAPQAFGAMQTIAALIKKIDAAKTGSVTQTPAPEYDNQPTQ